jgi:chromatin structure-remodeling complex protein RSC7
VYDPHTNALHFPKHTQPTHAKWERVLDQNTTATEPNGVYTNGNSHKIHSSTIFEPVSDLIDRNFFITDTVYTAPPLVGCGNPGQDGSLVSLGPIGLPDASDEILAELPEESRKALLEAREVERQWKLKWTNETEDAMRGNLKIGFMGFPV